jgi:hypothetical protein
MGRERIADPVHELAGLPEARRARLLGVAPPPVVARRSAGAGRPGAPYLVRVNAVGLWQAGQRDVPDASIEPEVDGTRYRRGRGTPGERVHVSLEPPLYDSGDIAVEQVVRPGVPGRVKAEDA